MRNRKRVTLRYKSAARGITQTRDVDPYGLAYRQGTWLVVGYCHLRKDVRSFRIDRIVDLAVATKPKSPDFDRPADFDVRTYASRSPWTFSPAPSENVELEFRPEVASIANEDFGPTAVRTFHRRMLPQWVRSTFPLCQLTNPKMSLSTHL